VLCVFVCKCVHICVCCVCLCVCVCVHICVCCVRVVCVFVYVGMCIFVCTCMCVLFCTMFLLTSGGITAGLISDVLDARAVTCVIMLLLAVPSVSLFPYSLLRFIPIVY